jgi:hypothetical protein
MICKHGHLYAAKKYKITKLHTNNCTNFVVYMYMLVHMFANISVTLNILADIPKACSVTYNFVVN